MPTPADIAAAERVKGADRDLGERLLKFSDRAFGPDWFGLAMEELFDRPPRDEARNELAICAPLALFHRPVAPGGVSPARAMLDQRTVKLSRLDRDLLESGLACWLSAWEVRHVERGVGIELADLLTGERRYVFEIAATENLPARTALLARVQDSRDISFLNGCHPHILPPAPTEEFVRAARKACRTRARHIAPERLRNWELMVELVDLWRIYADEGLAPQAPPELRNTDGDELTPIVDHFILTGDRAAALALLAQLPGAEPPEEGERRGETQIIIGRPAKRGYTVVGVLRVSGDKLRAETNSLRRADELRRALEEQLGGLLRHRAREESSIEAMLEQARRSGAPPMPRPEPSAEEQAALREFRTRYMDDWLDESIPALGGLTPRQAAASRVARDRRALDLLLRELEMHESTLPDAERINIGRLRSSLGLSS